MQTFDSTQLPAKLLQCLGQGETVTLMQPGDPLAFIVPALPADTERPVGLAKGQFTVPDDFNDPLPDLEAEIYGS